MLKYKAVSAFIFLLFVASCFGLIAWVYFMLALSVYLLYLVYGAANIRSQLFVKTINCNTKASNKIALTFDDGPEPSVTPLLLDLLKKHHAKATFFVIGKQLEKHGDIAKRMIDEGHEVANHSYSHHALFSLFLPRRMRADILKNQQIIAQISVKENTLFRPPYGVTNPFVARALNKMPLECIGWSVRSFDTTKKPKEKIFANVKRKVKPGDIVLLHDRINKTLWITEQLLDYMESLNIVGVTVSDLIKKN